MRELCNQAKKASDKGGLDLHHSVNGDLDLKQSSFGKCMPRNTSQMTDFQKAMLGCGICIDAHVSHDALMEWQNR